MIEVESVDVYVVVVADTMLEVSVVKVEMRVEDVVVRGVSIAINQ